MYAATRGKCDVVTELISLGADVGIQTDVSHFLCLIMTLPNGSKPPSAKPLAHTAYMYIPLYMHGNWPCLVL